MVDDSNRRLMISIDRWWFQSTVDDFNRRLMISIDGWWFQSTVDDFTWSSLVTIECWWLQNAECNSKIECRMYYTLSKGGQVNLSWYGRYNCCTVEPVYSQIWSFRTRHDICHDNRMNLVSHDMMIMYVKTLFMLVATWWVMSVIACFI